MAIVTFELEDLARLGIVKESLQETVDKLGMSLEAIDAQTVSIDITPNRPDMLGIVGFARAATFFAGKKAPKEKFYSIKSEPLMSIKVTKDVKKVRPFISAAVIKNVDLSGNKLKDLINFTEKFCETYGRKRKKIAMGLHNLDVIKGQLTYDASKEGEFVTLGSKAKMTFENIMEQHEKGVEYSAAIGKSKVYPYLKDSQNVLSLIPIINSELTRVTNSTKNLLVDITGTSQSAVEEAANLMACTFIDMGAEVYSCEIIYPNKKSVTPNLEYKTVKIKKSKVEKTLGMYLDDSKIVALANKLGHVAAKYGNYTLVYVPPYRLDVFNEQDVIEDIAIAYGYENIEPLPILSVSNGLPEDSKEQSNRISRLMIGMGFMEAMNPYLTNEELNFTKGGHKDNPERTIKVTYSKTEAITMLRTDLLPWLMQNLSNSTHDKMPQKLFELGSVFYIEKEKIIEARNIAIVSEHSKANFSEIKATVLEVLKFIECANYSIQELEDPAFIKGRAAKIMIGSDAAGYFGEINPQVLENFKIEEPVVAGEIKLDKCVKIKII